MSVMTGVWHRDGSPLKRSQIESVAQCAKQHGPDSTSVRYEFSLGLIFQSFDIEASSCSQQPHNLADGTTMMWDGRLDNKADLVTALDGAFEARRLQEQRFHNNLLPDVAVIHALYHRDGARCFEKILGDWALCVWDSRAKRLILACDYCGVRQLYYCVLPHAVIWCTDLKALLSGSGRTFSLCDAYINEFLESMPEPGRTPYSEIHAVPAGHWVEISERDINAYQYWNWDVTTTLTYKSDQDYEEHCRSVLRQSVRRRLQSEFPVMAELSGGVDSSSIVCLADDILCRGEASTPALRTISYFDDDEPTCDERPYFSVIEKSRNQIGLHINLASLEPGDLSLPIGTPVPIYPQGVMDMERRCAEAMEKCTARTLLSGIGGDEFLGGVPTAIPEIADLFRNLDVNAAFESLNSWSLASRISKWKLLQTGLQEAFTFHLEKQKPFAKGANSLLRESRNREKFVPYPTSSSGWLPSHSRPSQRMFIGVWVGMLRQLAYQQLPMFGSYYRTYPLLDRDVLVFLMSIPRTQIIRAGERRSLMRRALTNLVPHEVLFRKSKATTSRKYLRYFRTITTQVRLAMTEPSTPLVRLGYIDSAKFTGALDRASNGMNDQLPQIMRIIGLHAWLCASSHYISDLGRHTARSSKTLSLQGNSVAHLSSESTTPTQTATGGTQ